MLEMMTKNYLHEVDEFINRCLGEMMDYKAIQNMEPDELKIIQQGIGLVTTAKKLAVEQAKVLDEINHKLDLLLEQKG